MAARLIWNVDVLVIESETVRGEAVGCIVWLGIRRIRHEVCAEHIYPCRLGPSTGLPHNEIRMHASDPKMSITTRCLAIFDTECATCLWTLQGKNLCRRAVDQRVADMLYLGAHGQRPNENKISHR